MSRTGTTTGSRHGKHHPDKVILGCFVTPEIKALAMLVAEKKGCEVSALVTDGINRSATDVGIMVNGRITDDYDLEIKAIAARIRANKKTRQQKQKEAK